MGLAIAVFVPEGIVVATDGLEEIRNAESDQGFLHKTLKRLFVYKDRYVVCIHGYGFINGLPCAYYVGKVFSSLNCAKFQDVKEFANTFGEKLSQHLEERYHLSFYAWGIEENDNHESVPCIVLYDNGQVNPINRGNDGRIVFNYHSVGRCLWLNKLLLPTSYMIEKDQKIIFDSVDIDFSKYSLDDAEVFLKTIFRLSREMDILAQLKPMIGEKLSLCILSLDGNIELKSVSFQGTD